MTEAILARTEQPQNSLIIGTKPEAAATSPGSSFDINLSRKLYWQLTDLYGYANGSKIAQTIFTEDFRSLGWEASKLPSPNTFFYRIVQDGDQTKLVHQSDLHWQRDILDGVSPHFRDGLELIATKSFKDELVNSPVGETRLLISSKRDETETEERCFYTDTQVNVAEKVSDDLIRVRQFQSDSLDRNRSIQLRNCLVGDEEMGEDTSIDQLVTTISRISGSMPKERVLAAIGDITGNPISDSEWSRFIQTERRIQVNSIESAMKLRMAIQLGQEGKELEETFGRLLVHTIGMENLASYTNTQHGIHIATSCGFITVGSKGGRIGWMASMVGEKNSKSCEGCGTTQNVDCGLCKPCARKAGYTD